MALGGGTWISQNKVLPGSYINVVSGSMASTIFSERGYVAGIVSMGYTPRGVFTVTAEQFVTDSVKLFGYENDADELKNLRELFKNAKTAYLHNCNSEGTKASNTYATALHGGTAGNNFKIKIEADADDSNKMIVSTLYKNVVVDEQTVTKTTGSSITDNGLTDNDYVTFKKTVAISTAVAATSLSGGTDGTYSGSEVSAALTAFEGITFNVLFSDVTGIPQDTLISYTNRMRDDYGKKFQTVFSGVGASDTVIDSEGIIRVINAVSSGSVTGKNNDLVFWVAGAEAACPVNRSLTNAIYTGEYEIDTAYSQAELQTHITNGDFVFHKVNDDVRVLMDINTLKTTTAEKNDDFKSNQTIRVVDQIANDIATIFNTRYIGMVQNNESGRALFKSEIVSHHKDLQAMNAIEGFTSGDVTISPGKEKGAVVVTDAVKIPGAMTKLYMTVYVD